MSKFDHRLKRIESVQAVSSGDKYSIFGKKTKDGRYSFVGIKQEEERMSKFFKTATPKELKTWEESEEGKEWHRQTNDLKKSMDALDEEEKEPIVYDTPATIATPKVLPPERNIKIIPISELTDSELKIEIARLQQ